MSLVASLAIGAAVSGRAPAAGLRLGAVTAAVSGSTLTVQTSVTPAGARAQRYYVWFELVPAGERRAAYVSETVSGSARPPAEGDNPVAIRQPLDVPPGQYRLAVWLHERVRGAVAEADRWSGPLDLRGTDPAELRARAPRDVAVASAAITTGHRSPAALTGTVRLRNTTAAPRTVTVGVGLTDSTGARPTSTTRWAPPRTVTVPPGGTAEVAVAENVAVWPGAYRPTVEVRAGTALLDQLTGAAAVRVDLDQRLARTALPAGHLMVATGWPPATWAGGTRRTLAVTVANLSAERVTARLLPVLAPADAAEPWRASRISCTPVDATLPPHGRATLRATCRLAPGPAGSAPRSAATRPDGAGHPGRPASEAAAGPGELRLSYWVHERVGAAGFAHSDGVFALVPVRVTGPAIRR
ncbi:hypothetical protein RB614_28795 [Phytohabitans sp. ZYX-F-186]|uniref:Alpha-galactosidase NEW3 domain-containing protein n=1 Tax=Phytohabitans maris TaxID=3071409 RepID=A0ABU0ZNB7_9ACTN|nr:hypothetical protein [Phytohabitans sp. ZYX-F-186]MDQ7908535.1 hypothetical protein [Phytohabitans sp. ZYX-F-186]